MRRLVEPLLLAGCLLVLLLSCYGGVLFRNRQFGFRDAAHYYYPLHERVQNEWAAGRWPLWEPEENGGMPLLGNPTAAVLYPGKALYAIFPYAWGSRLYVVAHTVLAFLAMMALMRTWGTSWTGSSLSALTYAFGAPILFQYCNVIYLVGAAWMPLGFRAADRWLRLGRRRAILELAAVMALQTLGGDLESTYIISVCAAGYAVALAWRKQRTAKPRPSGWSIALLIGLIAVVWSLVVLGLALLLPAFRPPHNRPLPLPWMSWVPMIVIGLWATAGLVLLLRWLRRRRQPLLVPMLAGLAASAILAATLAAVQLIPVLEFTSQTSRAASGAPHDIYAFSLPPVRTVELIWPNFFGTPYFSNRSWLALSPLVRIHAKLWVPSLYLGGLSLVLALGALGFRNGPPWRGWLSAVAIVGLFASMGEYTSPIWWARWDPSFATLLGPHDSNDEMGLRLDGKLRDGDGGFYWFVSTILPGFRQFRYPSKLLTLTALGLSGLAGIGWDRLLAGRRQRSATVAIGFLTVSLVALAIATFQQGPIVAFVQASPAARSPSLFGPIDVAGAVAETQWALAQGSIVFTIALMILRSARRPGLPGAVAVVVLTADLTLANARYIFTVPQELMDQTPKVVDLIETAEREAKSPNPNLFRVQRIALVNPSDWFQPSSSDRVAALLAWERNTITPKSGVSYGIHYTYSEGISVIYEYMKLFTEFIGQIDAGMARRQQREPGQEALMFWRRAFDLWNTRYFVIAAYPNTWNADKSRLAALLEDTDLLDRVPHPVESPVRRTSQTDWPGRKDVQVLRNRLALPRAWVVHSGLDVEPTVGPGRGDHQATIEQTHGEKDPLSTDQNHPVFDPRTAAWLEPDDRRELSEYLPGPLPSTSESVTIAGYEPQRVELDAVLQRPGLVILADVYYPGWKLTIDGKEAPIYRANRMMRGAAVPSGRHRVVYFYEPRSFRVGGRITLAGIAAFAALGLIFARRPVSARLRDSSVQGG